MSDNAGATENARLGKCQIWLHQKFANNDTVVSSKLCSSLVQDINAFLSHLQNVIVDSMTDAERIKRGVEIRRPEKKRNLQNDCRIKACTERHDNGTHSRSQFFAGD